MKEKPIYNSNLSAGSLKPATLTENKKHENGNSEKHGLTENVVHVLIKCEAYETERFQLSQALRYLKIHVNPGFVR